jgi:two-component system, sensor histidine kinase and response regulator
LVLALSWLSSVPDGVAGDELRLRLILTNLVGNTIKFTRRGEVTVRVECGRRRQGETEVRFSVRDTGVGIPKSARRRIFEPFTQADSSTSRRFGGTGLGLAIASSLFFTLPLPESALADPDTAPMPALSEPIQGLRVLVVDDNQTNRHVLTSMLSAWSMQPLEAADAAEARRILRDRSRTGGKPRVALIDAVMPGEDGFSLSRWLRESREFNDMGIILLSSSGAQRRQECEEAGIDVCLEKPIFQQGLFLALARVIGSKAEPRPKVRDEAERAARPPNTDCQQRKGSVDRPRADGFRRGPDGCGDAGSGRLSNHGRHPVHVRSG